MTREAYITNFRKTAEALGVDIPSLVKKAAGLGTFGSMFKALGTQAKNLARPGALSGKFNRFGQLVSGGSDDVLGGYKRLQQLTYKAQQQGSGQAKRLASRLNNIDQGINSGKGTFSLNGKTYRNAAIADEIAKVRLARVGAGVAGVGGLYAANKARHALFDNKDQSADAMQMPQNDYGTYTPQAQQLQNMQMMAMMAQMLNNQRNQQQQERMPFNYRPYNPYL